MEPKPNAIKSNPEFRRQQMELRSYFQAAFLEKRGRFQWLSIRMKRLEAELAEK